VNAGTRKELHWVDCMARIRDGQDRRESFLVLAITDGVFKRYALTALVVGMILTAINQGDVILVGEAPSFFKIGLNYLVPFCVATFGAWSALVDEG